MRRLFIVLASLVVSVSAMAQPVLKDLRNNFKNFSAKTTMVVLSPDGIVDAAIRDAVTKGWKLSPYKFCNYNEYEKIKNDTSFFFLIKTDGRQRREAEPGIEYLTLVKGGYEMRNSIERHPELISLPLRSLDEDHFNVSYAPAYISIFQNYIRKIQRGVLLAFTGEMSYTDSQDGIENKTILFNTSDLSFVPEPDEIKWMFRSKGYVVEEEKISEALDKALPNHIVSLVIAPRDIPKGGVCYKLLISTDNHELLYYKKHKLGNRNPRGFSRDDIKRISIPYQH